MVLDTSDMSSSKVHVDESDPTGYEEPPFEPRDVQLRKGKLITDEYDIIDGLLGKGKFGKVQKCKEHKTGRILAVKFIKIHDGQMKKDVINEIEIMKCMQHPRLLQLYDAFEGKDNVCLVLELLACLNEQEHDGLIQRLGCAFGTCTRKCIHVSIAEGRCQYVITGGELFERVINDDFVLTERASVMFLRQICEGMEFMHSRNILHLDLKPENILCLTRQGNRVKIIDFGLARKYDPKGDLRVLFGTPEFMAPEVVNFDTVSPATDMWSVGIICYLLLSGLSPFMGQNQDDTLVNVTCAVWDFNAEEFESVSNEAKDFISSLLIKSPVMRLSAKECLEHKWLRKSKKREGNLLDRSLSKKRLRKFVYRRKWQKAVNAMLALKRMGVQLS